MSLLPVVRLSKVCINQVPLRLLIHKNRHSSNQEAEQKMSLDKVANTAYLLSELKAKANILNSISLSVNFRKTCPHHSDLLSCDMATCMHCQM